MGWRASLWYQLQALGTGNYLSPGGGKDFRGITWFSGEQKGGPVVAENPKGGIAENVGRIQGGTIPGEIAKVIKSY